MFGKIYLKLYFWFLLVFVLTIAVVSLLLHGFYAERIHTELEGQLESHARFLLSEYARACSSPRDSAEQCRDFLRRLKTIRPIRFWIVNRSGEVVLSNGPHSPPLLNQRDLERVRSGESVMSMRRPFPPHAIVPILDDNGQVNEMVIVERNVFRDRRFPRFPALASLLIAGITIAILILPLSKRLTKPVRELHRLGQEWAEGHLEKRAVISGKDEISDLGKTFNTMAENLQKILEQRKESLAWISHELKSPLARMKIALEILSEKYPEHTETEKLIHGLNLEIEESEKLIEQLLVLSRAEMNALSSMEPLNLRLVLEKASEQIRPLAEHRGVTLELIGEGKVRGDFLNLQKALENIIENATKFSDPGTTVSLSLQQTGGKIIFTCRDHGSGIEPDEIEMIFKPFYRGKTTKVKQGSGLGLFIAKRIVEMHQGSIHAEQNQPKGTIIVIELPAAL